jgi:hypothetical protein
LWEQHRAAVAGNASLERFEGALYTDAELQGELDLAGPLSIVSTGARSGAGVRMQAVCIIDVHSAPMLDGLVRVHTETSAYHGGDEVDEVAALISLALFTRCRSGGMIRSTGLDHRDGPHGRPTEWDHEPPWLATPGRLGPVLPSLRAQADVRMAHPLIDAYLRADRESAVEIIRAARTFEQALWVADTDPNLTWLLLVGSLEIAANQWAGRDPRAPIERLDDAWPRMADLCRRAPGGLRDELASELVGQVKVTAKVLRFVEHFKGDPPAVEIPEWARVDWGGLGDQVRKIYDYRSRALHTGLPFPDPMSRSPEAVPGGRAQRPTGLAASSGSATWAANDLPMYLDTFALVTHAMLLRWVAQVMAP